MHDEADEILTRVRGQRLTLSIRERGTTCEIEVHGELDLASAPVMATALLPPSSRTPRVVLDVSRLTFIDAGGLRQLLTLVEEGRTVVLRHPSRLLVRILDVTETEDRFGLEGR